MGALRIILALGVAAEHGGMTLFIGSYTAVQIFFIISGFYMSLILSARYENKINFYKSRFYRIFPTYWVVLLIALLYGVLLFIFNGPPLLHGVTNAFEQTGWLEKIWLIVANLMIMLSDWVWFFPVWGDVPTELHPVHWLIILPVWTVTLELYFYLLCPFLVRQKTSVLILIIFFSIAGRIYLYFNGLDTNPWHSRFFPFELVFFVTGIILHRVYEVKSTIWGKSGRIKISRNYSRLQPVFTLRLRSGRTGLSC